MGLIQAALGSAGGVMADQWKEYFYCDAIPDNTLAVRGKKRTSRRSSNTKGNDNIISNGSVIAVADGQCMLIVDQGEIVEVCAEPGEFIYDSSTEPTLFTGGLNKENIKAVLGTVGKRFTFGGEAPKDQRVYYFNTRELMGNKYGTASPVPFRVVDMRAGIDMDVSIKCFGEYSIRLTNPLLFYTNVCSNVAEDYKIDKLAGQMRSELLTALQPAFARLSEKGIRYSALAGYTRELADALNEELSSLWRDKRGIEIVSFGVSSVKADEEDERTLKMMQRDAAYTNPMLAAAGLVGAQKDAMPAAAKNPNGAMMGFMGMNMAGGGGQSNQQPIDVTALYGMGMQMQQQQMQQQAQVPPVPTPNAAPAGSWTCSCGATATGKFCPECGKPKPAPADSWTCSCGATVTGKFCPECGKPKPAAAQGWTCSCGTVNQGKFCQNCGAKKPADQPLYRCDKCGWVPEDPKNPPRFCPECGDPFNDEDIQ